jgi:hypothetical protein
MSVSKSPVTDDRLPPARLVRWILLAGVILFSVGLYFRFGTAVPPLGTATTTTTP